MNQVLALLRPHRIVPVVTADSSGQAVAIAGALADGGVPVAEITFRTAAAADAIAAVAARGDVLVGAGTVVRPDQVDAAVDAGARFIVSPGTSRAVVERCRLRGVPVLPGAVTATEIQAALELGITTVKFFPAAASGGAAALRALAAPFGEVTLVPTGGIGPDDLADYFAIPAVPAVGMSWMLPEAAVGAGDWAEVTRRTRRLVTLAGAPRSDAAAALR
ncbi:bifunctional 4-hydroxy-2-oxoglutarate aldolase/2-dehydro-3-deoxy-phosphogluconate aldolase [Microbacterium sp. zg.Y1090]|uniref:bifunctional 4-hydroxy-2-oxoglutarate aldolase/2-dehydro-3-deoxy-phosphogluconate aldolase n=1 Tax=Microbacterium TaxID=33882 RepID=UPI00214C67C4|nr:MULTISPECIES: bifunctional 4-hydroxy-2-oxoglutarate aldolase/2-dehydro-3-deoxy-phosphogluconate aldolase [unclassified Microbacterium]MCR2812200.1 bifunctional 4-hydroxy-2-oxoglutarate aldolase/2-dehydro-3-deoxy-phosphogluconate aldolase [Microbacterium sp. zg.Y1084]MCR2818362.1 bifunctional 4-hydroxy-2-oxoglutarate aldolase/2-dehydro-3-deoxy-phosphogluconate aldolase [Microbacterium sp. zg.Y1090]MDL5486174.1 bifunctional 4-hydroxy-2-oxoglutarate aldolase/2-dehydro-3-deoxy-phosphogluconate al